MTDFNAPVDNPAHLHQFSLNAEALLLDFDGPICSVFSGFPADIVADQLRNVLAEGGHTELPPEVENSEDPFDVFRYAATLGNREARYVEAALRAHEVEAVGTARSTPGAHELIISWHAKNKPVAIVSNNSKAAVDSYIYRHELSKYITATAARTSPDPSLLKPNPQLVKRAVVEVRSNPEHCLMVGDSQADIIAARAADVIAIGYANKSGKVTLLTEAGAHLILTNLYPAGLML